MKHRPALLASSIALVVGALFLVPGAAFAAAGGNPASADQPGCTFSQGTTTCVSTTSVPGSPVTVVTPGQFVSTTGPVYDFERATNAAGDCTPGSPTLQQVSTTTTTPTLVTTTSSHRGAPGSKGKDLGTTTTTAPGTPVVVTDTGLPSTGTATVVGSTATATLVGLTPNTQYVFAVRCIRPVLFDTDAAGSGTAQLDLSGLQGSLVQLEVYPLGAGPHTSDYSVTSPFTVQ